MPASRGGPRRGAQRLWVAFAQRIDDAVISRDNRIGVGWSFTGCNSVRIQGHELFGVPGGVCRGIQLLCNRTRLKVRRLITEAGGAAVKRSTSTMASWGLVSLRRMKWSCICANSPPKRSDSSEKSAGVRACMKTGDNGWTLRPSR